MHNPERSVRVCVFKCIVMGIELVSRFPNLIIPTGLGRSAHSMSKRRNLVTDENGADKNPAGLQRERERDRDEEMEKDRLRYSKVGHGFL